MTLVTDALAARRDRLVTALHDNPAIRDKLSLAEITTAVDTAMAEAMLPELLDTLVKAQAVAEAVAADVLSPPPSVTAALGPYGSASTGVNNDYKIFEP